MKWSKELDAVIKDRYPTEGSKIADELKLTRRQVKDRARLLGVRYTGKSVWMQSFYGVKHGQGNASGAS